MTEATIILVIASIVRTLALAVLAIIPIYRGQGVRLGPFSLEIEPPHLPRQQKKQMITAAVRREALGGKESWIDQPS